MAKRATFYTVSEFCMNSNWKKGTQRNYYFALLHYARFLFPQADPDKTHPEAAIAELERHIKHGKDPAKDLARYTNYVKDMPPKTTSLYLVGIRSYYELNGVIFNKQEMKRIIPRTGDAVTKQGEMTTELLKRMVDASDTRARVMIMLFASTACRIGELCSIQIGDVHMDSDPAYINIRKEIAKNRRQRYVFLTDECRDIVKIWLDSERMNYLRASYERNKGLNDQFRDKNRLPPEEDQRLLGLHTGTARQIWYTVLSRVVDREKLRPDTKTRIHPLSPHIIRKWWRITANQGIRNEDVCHIIMGHWSNSLDYVYAKMGLAGLAKEFKKGQHALSIITGESFKEIQEMVEKQSDRMLALERENQRLRAEVSKIPDIERMMKSITGNPAALKLLEETQHGKS